MVNKLACTVNHYYSRRDITCILHHVNKFTLAMMRAINKSSRPCQVDAISTLFDVGERGQGGDKLKPNGWQTGSSWYNCRGAATVVANGGLWTSGLILLSLSCKRECNIDVLSLQWLYLRSINTIMFVMMSRS